ncbi:fasciclin domain-containing protein [Sphingomicrobium sp. XHP0235]|uniref:fasciclin domain-containing protein n=1 Tax=Sphingomicrobium aquimarinum TaxID=3133971 RepID=UPI0031FE8F96
MKLLSTPLLLATAAGLSLAACNNDAGEEESVTEAEVETTTLTGAIPADSRFAAALEKAGLATLFEGPEPYTVLLPPDDAFPEELPEDGEELASILTMHILPGTILAEDIQAALDREEGASLELPTYGGSNLTVTSGEGGLMVAVDGGEAVRLVPGEQTLENGALHRIDGLLVTG